MRAIISRYAPAPTGFLHLGHVVNALYVWGVTRRLHGRVLLRIEDHDRQRSRSEYDAAIVDDLAWDALVDWTMGGGRFAACSMADLARLATIATPRFAAQIGQIAAQRAFELIWAARGPLRGADDLESALLPLVFAARHSPRAADALRAARAHAGTTPRRRLA